MWSSLSLKSTWDRADNMPTSVGIPSTASCSIGTNILQYNKYKNSYNQNYNTIEYNIYNI